MDFMKDLIIRYVALLLLGLGNLYLFYTIFTPLTIYPVFFVLSLFYSVKLSGIQLVIGNNIIELVTACIAGAAYYLLLILNLSTPMEGKKRFYSLFYMFSILLALNITRIVVLAVIFINNSAAFDFTHKFLWYGISTIFVVVLWFSAVKIFDIKKIPFYSDYKTLMKYIRRS